MGPSNHMSMLMVIVPQVVELIASKHGISEKEATKRFLESNVYELLEDEETKVWHLSPRSLLMMFDEEQERGSITFPEEV